MKQNRKITENMNKLKSWFLDIHQMNKHLVKPRKKERIQINKIINGKGDITANTTEIQRNISGYFEQLYTNKLNNLERTGKC